MAFYLLQEDGSRLYLEDLSGFLILEEESLAPTVDHQGGDGKKRRGRRRRRTHELMAAMETTLARILDGTLDAVVPTVAEAGAVRLILDRTESLESAARQLAAIASRSHRERHEIDTLADALKLYDLHKQAEAETDDEETWSLA